MPSEPTVIVPRVSGIATYPPGATFGPRRMREYEFVWIMEGNCRYWIDGVVFDALPGSIVLCRPGTVDTFEWDVHRFTRHAYFHFDLRAVPAGWPGREWPVVIPASEDDILLPLFRFVLAWADHGDAGLLRSVIATMLRAVLVDQRTTAAPLPPVAPDPVSRAVTFIYDRLAADASVPLPLAAIASAACVTPEHLCRLFRSAQGRSPMQFLRLARLDRAAELLSRSNFSVGQIAAMCGFASQFHFSRRFKEAYGIVPSTARARTRAGETPPLPRLLHNQRLRRRDQEQA